MAGQDRNAALSTPFGVAVDNEDNVYVADTGNHTIRKIDANGMVTTFAGIPPLSGVVNRGAYADGLGAAARFNIPYGIATDPVGNVYVADSGNAAIRRISPVGDVVTIGGIGRSPGNLDGTGPDARFNHPASLALDRNGRLLVTDTFNATIRIGLPVCPDRPVVDPYDAVVGVPRQLTTDPQTATAWRWSIVRRPDGSKAELSSPSVRNPTFTPDVADMYVFRMYATNENAGTICIRTLQLAAAPDVPMLTAAHWMPDRSFELFLTGQQNRSYFLEVSTDLSQWLAWTNIIAGKTAIRIDDVNASQYRQRFYRARTP